MNEHDDVQGEIVASPDDKKNLQQNRSKDRDAAGQSKRENKAKDTRNDIAH
jgi:hypothetical protein